MPSDLDVIEQTNHLNIWIYYALDRSSNLISPIALLLILGVINQITDITINPIIERLIGDKLDIDDIKFFMDQFNRDYVHLHNHIYLDEEIEISQGYLDIIANITDIRVSNRLRSTNCAYFQSTFGFHSPWQYQFESDTDKMLFHHTIEVETISQTNYIDYCMQGGLELVEIPYANYQYRFGIILSNEDIDTNIWDVPVLNIKEIYELINNMTSVPMKITIPKFQRNMGNKLKNSLIKNNVDIFTDDITIMDTQLNICALNQYVEFSVNDTGIETVDNVPDVDREFIADRVFLYYVRHQPSNMFMLFGDYQGADY